MEKKYFYVDNLVIYGRELFKKECFRLKFIKIEEGVYCLYDSKKRKIALSWKHPKDKEDFYIAFAICYHKLYGQPEPKAKFEMKEKKKRHFYDILPSLFIRNWFLGLYIIYCFCSILCRL